VNVTALLAAVEVVGLLREPELTLALAVTPYDPAGDLWFSFTFQLAIPLELVLATGRKCCRSRNQREYYVGSGSGQSTVENPCRDRHRARAREA